MKFLNFLVVILSLSVESVLSRPCDDSNCKDGAYRGTDVDNDCCLVECKRIPICDRINDIKDDDEKKKRLCQRRKSTCRFEPNINTIEVDDDKLGVVGGCRYKTAGNDSNKKGTSNVCNTFGGGCILNTATFQSEGVYLINDCLVEEIRMCTQNVCDYRLKPNPGSPEPSLRSECVSKPDECTAFISNECTEANGCVYDPCSDRCSKIPFDCEELSKKKVQIGRT